MKDPTTLSHDIAGAGSRVVLLHPGYADRRIWREQWHAWRDTHAFLRLDLPGFGDTPIIQLPVTYAGDVAALLDAHGFAPAALVGASLGARVALELAIARPEFVSRLVLVGAARPRALADAPEIHRYIGTLTAALAQGDLDGAVEASLRTWLDGPHRSAHAVDPKLRSFVATMQRRAFELTRACATTICLVTRMPSNTCIRVLRHRPASEPKVVRFRHAGHLEPIQEERELPPRPQARCPLRSVQVHVPVARVGRMQDRQGADPGIRNLRRVRPPPHRDLTNGAALTAIRSRACPRNLSTRHWIPERDERVTRRSGRPASCPVPDLPGGR